MRDETVFVFSFNQMNVPEPERKVAPLDSGYMKKYQIQWEALCRRVEPIMVADPRNLYIEVAFVADNRPIVRMMRSAKFNRTLGTPDISRFERIAWPEWFI